MLLKKQEKELRGKSVVVESEFTASQFFEADDIDIIDSGILSPKRSGETSLFDSVTKKQKNDEKKDADDTNVNTVARNIYETSKSE